MTFKATGPKLDVGTAVVLLSEQTMPQRKEDLGSAVASRAIDVSGAAPRVGKKLSHTLGFIISRML